MYFLDLTTRGTDTDSIRETPRSSSLGRDVLVAGTLAILPIAVLCLQTVLGRFQRYFALIAARFRVGTWNT